jgi:hypothetical protein
MVSTVCFLLLSFPALPYLAPPSQPAWRNVTILAPHPLARSQNSVGLPQFSKFWPCLGGRLSPLPPACVPFLPLFQSPLPAAGVVVWTLYTWLSLSRVPQALRPKVFSFELQGSTIASLLLSWGSLGCIPDTSRVAASFLFVTGKRVNVWDRKWLSKTLKDLRV